MSDPVEEVTFLVDGIRKPSKPAKLVKPVSKRTTERNMKALLRTLDAD
jgi:hypothetical protein